MPDLFNYLLTGKFATEKALLQQLNYLILESKLESEYLKTIWIGFIFTSWDCFRGKCSWKDKKRSMVLGDIPVVNVCSHDTAARLSQYLRQKVVYLFHQVLVFGWVELTSPLLTTESFSYGFTNEVGKDGVITFLKNCTGCGS